MRFFTRAAPPDAGGGVELTYSYYVQVLNWIIWRLDRRVLKINDNAYRKVGW